MLNDRFPSQLGRLLLALALAGCAPAAATGTPVSAPTPARSTPTSAPIVTRSTSPTPTEPSPTEPPTAEPTQAATPTAQPELIPGTFVEMVYHARLGQVVLVNGGPESGKPASDPVELWGWDGAAWSLLSADEDGPRWRNGASVAYDAARGQLVLLGGSQGRRNMLDMWLWDGAGWTEVSGDLPPYTGNTGIAYDAGRERVVLFGGSDVQFNLLAETWEWDGAVWTLVSREGPAPRFPGAMTYDAGRSEVLMYGGHSPAANGDFQNWGDTWGWDGIAWRQYDPPEPLPGIRPATRAVYDGNLNAVLLLGGVPNDHGTQPLVDMWSWDGTAWTRLDAATPSPREWHATAYDEGRRVVVLFGGFEAPPYLGTPPLRDTWEWNGMGWRCVNGCGE